MNLDALTSCNGVIAEQSRLLGLARNHHVNQRGQPMAFAGRPFLVEINDYLASDWSGDLTFSKATQVGISEALLLWLFLQTGWDGRIVGYVLPSRNVMHRFVQNRVNNALSAVGAFRERLPGGEEEAEARKRQRRAGGADPNNLSRKRFGAGTMLFLGAETAGDFVEFSADAMIIDEFDDCDPTFLGKAQDRIRESKRKQIVRVSNPRESNRILSWYERSDGRAWHHRCPHCREWQPLEWEVNIVERDDTGRWVPRDRERASSLHWVSSREVHAPATRPDIRPVCRRCACPFDRPPIGQWVASRTEAWRPRGYAMSRLDVLTDRISDLFVQFVAAQGSNLLLTDFYVGALGRYYVGGGMAVTAQMLAACATGEPVDVHGGPGYAPETMTCGVDVGSVLNVQVSRLDRVDGRALRTTVWVGAVTTEADVDDIVRRYGVKHLVIDAGPEGRLSQSIRDRHRASGECAVWLCQFHPTARVGVEEYGRSINYQTSVVTVDRTQLFDATHDEFAAGQRVLPNDVFTVLDYERQMTTPKRVRDEERGVVIWTKTAEPDHYRLADCYDRVAADMSQEGGKLLTFDVGSARADRAKPGGWRSAHRR